MARSSVLSLVLALGMGVSTIQGAVAAPTAAPDAPPGVKAGRQLQVTLLTGDRLQVTSDHGRVRAVSVDPAPRPNGDTPAFHQFNDQGHLYVVPADVTALTVNLLDRSLFDVTAMVQEGLDDTSSATIPMIVEYDNGRPQSRSFEGQAKSQFDQVPGLQPERSLESIGSVSADLRKARTEPLLRELVDAAQDGKALKRFPATSELSGVTHLWRDARTKAADMTSAPQIGAPQAWASGYSGQGVTVAVLDTGIDTDHPDLAGKVVTDRNFGTAPDTDDHFGHGTHVASIIAGSGTASNGDLKGVAYAANLINAKILDDAGFGETSWMIDGMEWAATNGADVMNLSIGVRGSYTDGTDPGAMAVNSIVDRYHTTVVVAAGNDGANGASTVTTPGSADKALTVAAVDADDAITWFSGRGPRAGDWALKPDLSAPGNEIVAARAGGTSMGNPVNDFYTAASGTSMATPHVAAAVALLLQQRPDLTPSQIKSLLMGSSTVLDESVWDQGAGRLYLPTALDQQLITEPASLSMGAYLYPQTGRAPETRTLTYRNLSDSAMHLQLAADVSDADGNAPATGQFELSATSVDVPAGGLADVQVTVDPQAGAPGLYSGQILATGDNGELIHTPIGYYKEDVRYELRIRGFDDRGQPATSFGTVDVINVDDSRQFSELTHPFANGEVVLRVPPGHYAVMGFIGNYEDSGIYVDGIASVMKPEVNVTGDTVVELDARQADPIQVKTDRPTERLTSTLSQYRGDALGRLFVHSYLVNNGTDTTITPTDPVQVGDFEAYTRYQLQKPLISMTTRQPSRSTVDAVYATDSKKLDGTLRTDLVYAGIGRPEDFAGIDVTGNVALIQRGELTFVEKIRNAEAAGAASVLIFNNRPGMFFVTAPSDSVPVLKADQPEGERLLAMTQQGRVEVELVGTPQTPYTYDVMFPETAVPENSSYVVSDANTARVTADYRAFSPRSPVGETRHMWRPYDPWSVAFLRQHEAPITRTEYLSSGDSRWAHYLEAYSTPASPFNGTLLSTSQPYAAGEVIHESWLHQAARVGLKPWLGSPDGSSAYRDGNLLGIDMPAWIDNEGHFNRTPTAGNARVRLYAGNNLLVDQQGNGYAQVNVPGDQATYRLVADSDRSVPWWPMSTSAHTEWTFDSATTNGPEVLPLLDVDLHVGKLDDLNRGRANTPLSLVVKHQEGSTSSAAIRQVQVWWSGDDGQTWHAIGAKEGRNGHYDAAVKVPAGVPWVSLRVRATDAIGASVEEQVIRAYSTGG